MQFSHKNTTTKTMKIHKIAITTQNFKLRRPIHFQPNKHF